MNMGLDSKFISPTLLFMGPRRMGIVPMIAVPGVWMLALLLVPLARDASMLVAAEPGDAGKQAATKAIKLPVPGAAEEQAAQTKVREVFAKEFSTAKTSEQKAALAANLLKVGLSTKDSPVDRFVVLRLASQIFGQAGDLTKMMEAIDAIGQQYRADVVSMKADALAEAVRAGGRSSPQPEAITETALQLLDDSVALDDFTSAERVLNVAISSARKARAMPVIRDLTTREREIQHQKKEFTRVKSALETLEKKPADSDASRLAGQWYCFHKGNWEKGLPYLALGADSALAKLAREDISQPTDATKQTELAEKWSALAEKAEGSMRDAIRSRARHWYEQALPKLSGLNKARVERQLDLLSGVEQSPDEAPVKRTGVIQKGNVALATNGTTVSGPAIDAARLPSCLIDGETVRYDRSSGHAASRWPCEWIVVLNKLYLLRELRLKLCDLDQRSYRYAISVSTDGKRYTTLVDRSQGQWPGGWQKFQFRSRAVKYIKLSAFQTSVGEFFGVVELEAYCLPDDFKSAK